MSKRLTRKLVTAFIPRGAGWNNDRPSDVYWSYGDHNLSNQYGNTASTTFKLAARRCAPAPAATAPAARATR
jgi:hypothetical protein